MAGDLKKMQKNLQQSLQLITAFTPALEIQDERYFIKPELGQVSNAINWTILCIITCTESSSVALRLGPDTPRPLPNAEVQGHLSSLFIQLLTPMAPDLTPQHPAPGLLSTQRHWVLIIRLSEKSLKALLCPYLLALCPEQLASSLLVSFSSSIKWDNNSTKAWRSHCWLNKILAQCLAHGQFPLQESYYIANNWQFLRK